MPLCEQFRRKQCCVLVIPVGGRDVPWQLGTLLWFLRLGALNCVCVTLVTSAAECHNESVEGVDIAGAPWDFNFHIIVHTDTLGKGSLE